MNILTAEQVREAIERNIGKVAVLGDGKPVEWRDDWVCKVAIDYRGIADELNATLGSGECEFIDESDGEFPPKCSACGYEPSIYECSWLGDGGYKYEGNYCSHCGARVIGEDE